MRHYFWLFLFGALLAACAREEINDPLDTQLEELLEMQAPDGNIEFFLLPEGKNLANIPAGRMNPLTPEKIALGRQLFFETGLSVDALNEAGKGSYSCASCHVPAAGFMAGRPQGIGDGGIGFGFKGEARRLHPDYRPEEIIAPGIRPLSLLNVAYVTNTTWSGKFGANYVNSGTESVWEFDKNTAKVNHLGLDGLEAQHIEDLDLHRMRVDPEIVQKLGYKEMFDAAFPDFPVEKRYGPVSASFALSAYVRSLITHQAPFQRWLRGEKKAMREVEKRGALLFFGKAACVSCHKGPALNSVEFHAVGVKDLYETGAIGTGPDDPCNMGRGGFTRREEDYYKFKVPQLYNLASASSFFHGGSKGSLREVVEYFNAGVAENPRVPASRLSPGFRPLHLSPSEIDDLVAFLATGLQDTGIGRYVPVNVASGQCFPNNDPVSRRDLGCE